MNQQTPQNSQSSGGAQTVRKGSFSLTVGDDDVGNAPAVLETPTPAAVAAFAGGAKTRNLAPLPSTFFKIDELPNQSDVTVRVKGQIKQTDTEKSQLLKLPGVTAARLEKIMVGAWAPGMVALIEFAMDQMEKQGISLEVTNFK